VKIGHPIYNVFCCTCTSVEGIAVKFEAPAKTMQ